MFFPLSCGRDGPAVIRREDVLLGEVEVVGIAPAAALSEPARVAKPGVLPEHARWHMVAGEQVPSSVLGRETRLGQTSWLGMHGGGGDADDLYLAQQDIFAANDGGPSPAAG
jgi:hypothetical protein